MLRGIRASCTRVLSNGAYEYLIDPQLDSDKDKSSEQMPTCLAVKHQLNMKCFNLCLPNGVIMRHRGELVLGAFVSEHRPLAEGGGRWAHLLQYDSATYSGT